MDKKDMERLDAVLDAKNCLQQASAELDTYMRKRRHGSYHGLAAAGGSLHEARLCLDRLEELR